MKYRDAESPEQYLEYVLANWEAYRRSNGGICRAIKDLLEKVKKLEREGKKDHDER